MTLQRQYGYASKAMLEIAPKQDIPTLGQIEAALTDKQKKMVKDATMVIVPPLSWQELVAAFDKKQTYETYIWQDLWEKYDFGSGIEVCFVLPDLEYTGKTVAQQRAALKKDKLPSINPREYITLQAVLRESGQTLLDKTTWCRFVDEPEKPIGGRVCVPGADVNARDQLVLDGSDVGGAWGDNGVRRVVRVALDLNLDASLEPFSSVAGASGNGELNDRYGSQLQANTEAINKLRETLERIFK